MGKRAVLVVNTRSRRGREWLPRVSVALEERGVDLSAIHAFKDPRLVAPMVQEVIRDGVETVVVGGGDGTFGAVAGFFAESHATLGVLPLGTGNAFARDLGIPSDVNAACEVIAEGRTADVDVGIFGQRHFVNVATVGLTTRIAESLTVEGKRRFGRLIYLVAIVRAMRSMRSFRARITEGGQSHEFETVQIVIGSGRFHAGPFPIAPDASITDGKLSIYALAAKTRYEFLRFALKLPGGHHVELTEVPSFTATGGLLETWPTQRVTVDGEICEPTPARFGILPGAVRVLVPETFEERQQEALASSNEDR